MKTRQGFVSNSSSSSFIIRGICLSSVDIIQTLALSMSVGEYDSFDAIRTKLNGFGFAVEPSGNFFGSVDYDEIIFGKSIGYLEDGAAVELKDDPERDKEIIEKLEMLGFKGELSTFIQMISNDNY